MGDPGPVPHMASFVPLDPRLVLASDTVGPNQLSAASLAQLNTPDVAWGNVFGQASLDVFPYLHIDVATGQDQTGDRRHASSSPADDNDVSPLAHTISSTSLRQKPSSQLPKPAHRGPRGDSSSTGTVGEDKAKRTESLKRNRMAASKCREKKKVSQHNLEEQKSDLEAQNSRLQREYNELLEEVSQMKNYLMVHAGCDDNRIDRWIKGEATRFVHAKTSKIEQSRVPCNGKSWLALSQYWSHHPLTRTSTTRVRMALFFPAWPILAGHEVGEHQLRPDAGWHVPRPGCIRHRLSFFDLTILILLANFNDMTFF